MKCTLKMTREELIELRDAILNPLTVMMISQKPEQIAEMGAKIANYLEKIEQIK